MKKMMVFFVCLILAVTLVSCATYPLPITATGNDLGTKVGYAKGYLYFGLWGDASDANIHAAARNGNITKISTVDVQFSNFFTYFRRSPVL
jgi:hypothetical protein